MAMQEKNQVEITERLLADLDRLSPERRVVFGLSCVERLFDLYVLFQSDTGLGSQAVFRQILETAWTAAFTEARIDTEALVDRLVEIAPEEAEQQLSPFGPGAYAALNALVHSLRAFNDPSGDSAARASVVARNAIRDYVRWAVSPLFAEGTMDDVAREELQRIDWYEQPLVRYEIKKQEDDIALVHAAKKLVPDLRHVLQHQGARGIAPLERGLLRAKT